MLTLLINYLKYKKTGKNWKIVNADGVYTVVGESIKGGWIYVITKDGLEVFQGKKNILSF